MDHENEDDFDQADYEARAGLGHHPRLSAIQAKDMLGIGGDIVRCMLAAKDYDELQDQYGLLPEGARLSLQCAELAELVAWDEQALIEVATVWQASIGASEEIERISRRVRLAAKAELAGGVVRPVQGLLLLTAANVHVFHELRDAVLANLTDADWIEAAGAGLLGEVSGERLSMLSPPSESDRAQTQGRHVAKSEMQDMAVLRAICSAGHDPLSMPTNTPGLPGVKSLVRQQLKIPGPVFQSQGVFDKAWDRLRRVGQIRDKT